MPEALTVAVTKPKAGAGDVILDQVEIKLWERGEPSAARVSAQPCGW